VSAAKAAGAAASNTPQKTAPQQTAAPVSAPKNPADLAKADQGRGFYPGVDAWQSGQLQPGNRISQFDFRDAAVVRDSGTVPSPYFTADAAVDAALNKTTGKIDASKYARAVQVAPHRSSQTGQHLYPQHVAVYEVVKPLPMATSKVENNLVLGRGGVEQYRASIDRTDLIKAGYIKRVAVYETESRRHGSRVFKEIEANSLSVPQAQQHVQAAHRGIKEQLRQSGVPALVARVAKMDALENESAQLRGEPKPNKEQTTVRTANAVAPGTRAPMPSKRTLAPKQVARTSGIAR
jgi:hypothetical protein